jgi:AcrR family transcriptional regulator
VSLRVKGDPVGHNGDVAERWTPERRRQHTRDVLLDAAEDVFARRGFEGAALEEIAEAAGYTRGAIYKNFGSKEELFLAVNHRFNERFLSTFAYPPGTDASSVDLVDVARHWHAMDKAEEPRDIAIGLEFQLYLLRNPEARARVAEQQQRLIEMVAAFMEEQAARIGVSWRIPVTTVARLVMATVDGLRLAQQLDESDEDLYVPFLEALMSFHSLEETSQDVGVSEVRARNRSADADGASSPKARRRRR